MSPVWIVSYPKSGRTWLRYVFQLTDIPTFFTHAGSGSGAGDLGKLLLVPEFNLEDINGRKVIFLYRNPIDVCVSLYFQIHRREFVKAGPIKGPFRRLRLSLLGRSPPKDIEGFVRSACYGVEKAARFNRYFLDALDNREEALIVRYEELRANPRSGLERIFRFIDADLNQIDLDKLVEQTSFDAMRKVEMNAPRGYQLAPGNRDDAESFKVRRGKVGGYKDYLRPDTIAFAESLVREYEAQGRP